ncbi:kinase-like domain-containing protein [Crepidotus variabilis]|uniref:Kinase-like domain-containing protein n=1 Tax=Crepidotus variabilis TaxID=179855 RepID=A0A9P6EBQ0_9AGAR|nr:kinase-like domain-containing protein [Crepidotus variabilis]
MVVDELCSTSQHTARSRVFNSLSKFSNVQIVILWLTLTPIIQEMDSELLSPFSLPDPTAYLKLVKKQLSSSRSMLGMRIAGPSLDDWNRLRRLKNGDSKARSLILRIAQKLENHPRLLYGVNCLTRRYRLECSTTAATVKHFVLVDQESNHSRVYSFTNHTLSVSLTSRSMQKDDFDWEGTIRAGSGASPDGEWLACVAQILQEIINSSQIERSCRQIARTRLHRLAKAGFLPLSSFIHFVESEIPHFDSMIEYSTSGGFCDAHKISVNKMPVCFRVLRQWESSDSGKAVYKQFCRELSVWQQLSHPNILPLIGATTEAFPNRYCFLVPWLSNGSITSYLKTHPDHNRYTSICNIVDGLNYLHSLSPPVGHKDLKGDNVLVRDDLVCVITDFGLASVLDTQRTTTAGRDCRPRDVYSLGCTIYEILTGEPPSYIWHSVIKEQCPLLPPPMTPDWGEEIRQLWDLVAECINIDPSKRPTIRASRFYLRLIQNDEQTPPEHIVNLIKKCVKGGYWGDAERLLNSIFNHSKGVGSKRRDTLHTLINAGMRSRSRGSVSRGESRCWPPGVPTSYSTNPDLKHPIPFYAFRTILPQSSPFSL